MEIFNKQMGEKTMCEHTITINGKIYTLQNEKVEDGDLTYCVVRTYSAGVFAGWYDLKKLSEKGVVKNARRIWYWEGAASLSQLALEGVKKPESCKFSVAVPEEHLTNIIEIVPCSADAKKSIEGVKEWKN